MSFAEQLIRLFSEPPGNLVFQLVTLFAIQVTLALAWWLWRRQRADGQPDPFTWRLLLASAGLLGLRIVYLLVVLWLPGRGETTLAYQVLPPLEQAMNTATIILLAWPLLPPLPRLPRLIDMAALLLLLLTGAMYLSFAPAWAGRVAPGVIYNGTGQATVWSVLQTAILVAAVGWLLARRIPGRGLRLAPLSVLLLAHLIHFWNYPEAVPSSSEIAHWVRLGQLVALPLLAVVAYRHTLAYLLLALPEPGREPAVELPAQFIRAATQVVRAFPSDNTTQLAIDAVAGLFPADFAALAMVQPEAGDELRLYWPAGAGAVSRPGRAALAMDDWSAVRLALKSQQSVVLQAGGFGAHELQALTEVLGAEALAFLLVEPLLVGDAPLGVLLLGCQPGREEVGSSVGSLAPSLAAFLASTLANAQAYQEALRNVAPMTPASEAVVTGRVIALEEERDRAKAQVEVLHSRWRQTEGQLLAEQQRATELVGQLAAQELAAAENEKLQALQEEITILREALREAEEAMALVAAGEGGLNPEWVLLTISRYSGELEAAQTRIVELEAALAQQDPNRFSQVITSLVQELRTPLTSIEGYTDLLLGESVQVVDNQQRDFLQRVKANAERMRGLLEQIVRLVSGRAYPAGEGEVVLDDPREQIEAAISMVMSQLRKKDLQLRLVIEEDIPQVALRHNDLCEIMVHLLGNATQASEPHAPIRLAAHTEIVADRHRSNGQGAANCFLHLSVTDSSQGIRPEDLAYVFSPQFEADSPLIDGVGDTNAGLAVAHALVTAYGGRLWVKSSEGQGNTFSVLLPVATAAANGVPASAEVL